MKIILLHLVAITLISLPLAARAEDDARMPPKDARGEWTELNEAEFNEWNIKSFLGWKVLLDMGSQLFVFETNAGERFGVMAANQLYWTSTELKLERQVFFVIHKSHFYRIVPKSDEERNIVEKLEKAKTLLSGEGNKDPKLLNGLIERLKSRASMFKPKG